MNYACHPTTLAWQNTLISPDYVGACEVIERETAVLFWARTSTSARAEGM